MTIAAGFSSASGAVLCADSEETAWLKGSTQKAYLYPLAPNRMFGMASAGHASLCDLLQQQIWYALVRNKKADLDLGLIEEVVERIHKRHIWPNPDKPSVGAVLVLTSPKRGPRLIRVLDGVVTEHQDYVAVGVGADMATYWQRILMRERTMALSMNELIAIATYVVWQTKQSVPGCGGRTSILVFSPNGGMGSLLTDAMVQELETSFQQALHAYGDALRNAFMESSNDVGLDNFIDIVRGIKGVHFEALMRHIRSRLRLRGGVD